MSAALGRTPGPDSTLCKDNYHGVSKLRNRHINFDDVEWRYPTNEPTSPPASAPHLPINLPSPDDQLATRPAIDHAIQRAKQAQNRARELRRVADDCCRTAAAWSEQAARRRQVPGGPEFRS
jgi:hypothetical protein